MSFLFFIFFIGIFIAMCQDFRRREVDDWLNFLLFFSGSFFLVLSLKNFNLASYGFFTFLVCIFSFALYYLRFFAGGDAKLVFAMTPLFYEIFLMKSIQNLSVFFILLFFSGAVYGLGYLIFSLLKNFKKFKKEFFVNLKKSIFIRYITIFSFFFLVLSFWNIYLLSLFILIFSFSLLFLLAKSVEKVSFIVRKKTTNLVEGDWLEKDISVGKSTVKSSWEGLSKRDILLLKKYHKTVIVKEGIPYVPAFFIAFCLYLFREHLFLFFF